MQLKVLDDLAEAMKALDGKKILKLLQKSSQASKTFFELLQIKRLQLKLTNNLQNSYQISSQHQVLRHGSNNTQKHQKPQKQTKIHLQAFFSVQRLHGFRQVVQLHVSN
jgi:hypothetical protein